MKCGGFFPSPVVYCFSLAADFVIFLLHYWSAQLKEKLWSRAKPCLTAPVCHASMRYTHYSLFRFGSLCCANCVGAKHSTKTHLVCTRCDFKADLFCTFCNENSFFTCYFVYAFKKVSDKNNALPFLGLWPCLASWTQLWSWFALWDCWHLKDSVWRTAMFFCSTRHLLSMRRYTQLWLT